MRRDRTILDVWFARQYREWWRQWRWVVFAVLAVIVLRMAYGGFVSWVVSLLRDMGGQQFRTLPAYYVWRDLDQWLRPFLRIEDYLWLPIGTILGCSLVWRLTPPGEIAAVIPARVVYQAVLARARRALGGWLAVLVFVPGLFSTLTWITLNSDYVFSQSGDSVWSISLCSNLIPIIQVAGILLFFSEWQLSLLLTLPPSLSQLHLYAMPVIITVVAHRTMGYFGRLDYTNYAPLHLARALPQADDFWIAALHVGALATGLLYAMRWWSRVIASGRIKHWWWLIASVCIGLVLPTALWLRPNIWIARTAYTISAFLRGIYLGNPFAGWSLLQPQGVNPYSFDWSAWPQTVEDYSAIGLERELWDIVLADAGVVLSPWVYIPISWALVWCILYYAYSVLILWRANNNLPRGYRGTWES